MFNNKLLVAFGFLVAASGLYWMAEAQTAQQQLSYAQQGIVVASDTSGGLQIGLSESDAFAGGEGGAQLTTCPNVDFNVKSTLQMGSQGDEVTQLQQFLLGLYPAENPQDASDRVSGTFGPVTQTLVKQYQQENGLSQSGKVDISTRNSMYDDLRPFCTPRIASIDPQRPQRNETVTIPGSNFSTKNSAKIKISQTDNGGWPYNQNYTLSATSTDGTTLQFKIPANARALGKHDDRFTVRVVTNISASNKAWMYVYVAEYDQGRNVPQQTPVVSPTGGRSSNTCSALGTQRLCVANRNPACEWYNGACKLPSCGGLSVATGKDDKSTYKISCGNKPGSRWAPLGPTDDCGWTEGSTQKGCFYQFVNDNMNPPTANPTPKPIPTETTSAGFDRCTNDYRVKPSACNADSQCVWDYSTGGSGKCVTKGTEGAVPADIYCRTGFQFSIQKCNADPKCQYDWINQHCTAR